MPHLALDSIRVDRAFASRLPTPSQREFRGLVDDIRSRGVVVDLLVTKDGLLLDGHRRLAAAQEAGLSKVPVKTLDLEGETSCERAVSIAVNLFRRNLSEAQRVALGSSLLRIERSKAQERQREGQKRGGETAGRGRQLVGNDSPDAKERDRATDRVAGAVGVSRKTFERVEAVKRKDPEVARRMLEGSLSVASAYKKVKVAEIKERAAKQGSAAGLLKDLRAGFGRYRTIYLDPPWQYRDTSSRGAAESHYPTLSLKELTALPVPKLGHDEGARFWLWCTWPLIREGTPHELLAAWNLRWAGEIVWDKQILGIGNFIRSRTEILILAVTNNAPLLSDCVDQVVSSRRGAHSEKPQAIYELLEKVSPGPMIELFARKERKGWDRWGLEA